MAVEKALKEKGYIKGFKNCQKWHVHQNGRASSIATWKLLSLSKCLLGETRADLGGRMVLWCNCLVFKNHFKMFFVNFKKCNVRDVTSRTMFCCHYFGKFLIIIFRKMSLNLFIVQMDVYKTWTGVHGPPNGPGPWTTPWTRSLDPVHGPPHGPPLIFKRKRY